MSKNKNNNKGIPTFFYTIGIVIIFSLVFLFPYYFFKGPNELKKAVYIEESVQDLSQQELESLARLITKGHVITPDVLQSSILTIITL